MKKLFLFLGVFFIGLFLFLAPYTNAASVSKDEAHKAIVKIKSFTLNDDNELSGFSSGSGVIIDPSGIVLTNYHVVTLEDDFDNTKKESSYIICLTENSEKEPECLYTGRLIERNKDLDLALLKIHKTINNDKTTFPYLDLNISDTTSINDEVTALGYPAIGGDTITITRGVLSGKENKYNKNWLKTDAIISYGSSGGAAVDSEGRAIGITSSAHSDTIGSLGYIINITSINSWINVNKTKNPQITSLEDRTIRLISRIFYVNSAGKKDVFTDDLQTYSITKPTDWNFTYEDEAGLDIDKKSDDEGGIVKISVIHLPYLTDTEMVEGVILRALSNGGLISVATIIKNEDVTINGIKAKKVIISLLGSQSNYYYIPVQNYLLVVGYDYGINDKDKEIIDDIINSITISNVDEFKETKKYSNENPKFHVKSNDRWLFLVKNSKTSPIFIANKDNKLTFAGISVRKTDDNTKNLNNEEYLKYLEQQVKEINNVGIRLDVKIEVLKKDAHYKLNDELRDVIMLDYVAKSVSTDEILTQSRDYYVKSGDKYISPGFKYYNNNIDDYSTVLNQFNKMLSSLSLRDSVAIAIKKLSMYNRLKGKIMLKVEDKGKAYYIHPQKETMHYLGRPRDAFNVMREQGVGITTANLEKIPIGMDNLSGKDSDGDGLPDIFEDAIGTDKNKADTDGDGFNDKDELLKNYNPKGGGVLNHDLKFSGSHKGKIFLQVEGKGEAWYINPNNGKRYFLGRPTDAFNVMRQLGLGISNNDFDAMSG